jgi:hypothetical protein
MGGLLAFIGLAVFSIGRFKEPTGRTCKMTDYTYLLFIGVSTFFAFAALTILLAVKRIDSNNTVFVACIIVVMYIVSVIGLLPANANDKAVVGLVSIGSAVVGFLSRGLLDGRIDADNDRRANAPSAPPAPERPSQSSASGNQTV